MVYSVAAGAQAEGRRIGTMTQAVVDRAAPHMGAWVSVGIDQDTLVFAVVTIEHIWWRQTARTRQIGKDKVRNKLDISPLIST